MQNKLLRFVSAFVGGFCCLAFIAHGQVPAPKHAEGAEEEVIELDTAHYVEPEKYGMTILTTPSQLGPELESLCPKGKPAKPKTICAFISYAPRETNQEAYQNSLLPIFRSVGEMYWTFVDGKLTLATASALTQAIDLTDPHEPGRKNPYPAMAIVGFESNEERCLQRQECIDVSFFKGLVNDARILTPACVDEIWNKRGGSSDADSQSRCRFDRKR